ncbi:MAG: hypothetical protein IPL33_12300 [Sphingobacteriales bacterium]|nr:hypothetical protein [Sphingobacteriales bacterium]
MFRLLCCLAIGLCLPLPVWSQQLPADPKQPLTIYQVRDSLLMRIEPRYYTEWIDKEDTFSIRLNGGNRNRELFGRGYDTSVKTIQEWFDQLEPRLYPSGNFVNAWTSIFDEIKRLEKAQQQAAEKQPGPCDVSAQWRNIGPFARQTDPLAQETNASNSLSAHPSAVPGIGRVNFIKKHPSITGTIYIGASNGGLWKSTDSGST